MNKKNLEKYKQVLLEKQKKVKKNLEYLKSVTRESTAKDSAGEHSSYSFHMADQGTDAMEREKAFMFFARDEKYLSQLDEAFERIENGTYGICRVCTKDIGEERLEAVPTTTICYDCKVKES